MMVLHVTAGIAILACAVAIAVAPSAPDLWRPPAVLGAGMSPGAFARFESWSWSGREG